MLRWMGLGPTGPGMLATNLSPDAPNVWMDCLPTVHFFVKNGHIQGELGTVGTYALHGVSGVDKWTPPQLIISTVFWILCSSHLQKFEKDPSGRSFWPNTGYPTTGNMRIHHSISRRHDLKSKLGLFSIVISDGAISRWFFRVFCFSAIQ